MRGASFQYRIKMIDIKQIIANPEAVRTALLKRLESVDFTELLQWESERKSLVVAMENKRNERNKGTAEISRMMKEKQDATTARETVKQIGKDIADLKNKHDDLATRIHDLLVNLPNIPEDIVPAGGKENNVVIETFGEKPGFDFKTKDHVDLATDLKLVDYARGTKMGGTRKWVYYGDGALLEWGLINYFINHHIKNGYAFMLPPHILNAESGYVAGQFPKFKEDVFHLDAEEDATHFLLPTSETAIANFYRDDVLREAELPKKIFSYTPCYRKEAGGYRTSERGTIRGNQFNKVEIFHLTTPEQSEVSFQEILATAKQLLRNLGLHFRVSRLAADDCSASMAKTYDLEVWIPSINDYKEVSSVSTAHTYQAIRGNIRYKDAATKKNKYVHTLNGSALATSRLFPAILEQFQQADGRVKVPEVLVPFLGKEYFE